jgi:hypothetical protein
LKLGGKLRYLYQKLKQKQAQDRQLENKKRITELARSGVVFYERTPSKKRYIPYKKQVLIDTFKHLFRVNQIKPILETIHMRKNNSFLLEIGLDFKDHTYETMSDIVYHLLQSRTPILKRYIERLQYVTEFSEAIIARFLFAYLGEAIKRVDTITKGMNGYLNFKSFLEELLELLNSYVYAKNIPPKREKDPLFKIVNKQKIFFNSNFKVDVPYDTNLNDKDLPIIKLVRSEMHEYSRLYIDIKKYLIYNEEFRGKFYRKAIRVINLDRLSRDYDICMERIYTSMYIYSSSKDTYEKYDFIKDDVFNIDKFHLVCNHHTFRRYSFKDRKYYYDIDENINPSMIKRDLDALKEKKFQQDQILRLKYKQARARDLKKILKKQKHNNPHIQHNQYLRKEIRETITRIKTLAKDEEISSFKKVGKPIIIKQLSRLKYYKSNFISYIANITNWKHKNKFQLYYVKKFTLLKYYLRYMLLTNLQLRSRNFIVLMMITLLKTLLQLCDKSALRNKLIFLFLSLSFLYRTLKCLRLSHNLYSRKIGILSTLNKVIYLTLSKKLHRIQSQCVIRFYLLNNKNLSINLIMNYILIKLGQYFYINNIVYPLKRRLERQPGVDAFRMIITGRLTRKERAFYKIISFRGKSLPLSTYHTNGSRIFAVQDFKIMRFGCVGIKLILKLSVRALRPYTYSISFTNKSRNYNLYTRQNTLYFNDER